MTFDQVIVLGAGAIGSTYGALLSQKYRVILVGRPAHMKAIREKGLTMVGDAAGTYTMETTTEITEIPPKTLLLVTVKAHNLHEALTPIREFIKKDTTVLFLQNGLGIKELAQKILTGRGKIVCGVVVFGADFLGPGCIRANLGFTFLDSDADSMEVSRFFTEAGLVVVNSEDFQADVWRKVVINCVVNPLSAILQAPTKSLVSQQLASIRRGIVEECIAVGQAEGIHLDLGILEIMESNMPSFKNRSSMLQDVMYGRKTEIDFLNGRIVEIGRRHQIPTPVNETLTQLIRYLEAERQ
ncbi:MAG: ketopantoate reductase family protein [Promethearchaeota archaeon]